MWIKREKKKIEKMAWWKDDVKKVIREGQEENQIIMMVT